ncbi:MAG TPA: PRC-barrel domain-containing protein [Euzebya sp.]|nr:PRC-barrel domain-containing protein [Euzebya sp.]
MNDPHLLTHALDVPGRPVVTLAGEDIAQIRDVLFDRGGSVGGFTLAGRGMMSGPMHEHLPWSEVHGFGPDAVIVRDEGVLHTDAGTRTIDGGVIGDEVLTESGTVIGVVTDAVLRLGAGLLDVVGYEVEAPGSSEPRFIPLPDTLAVAAGRLVVPDTAVEFLSHDLAGFGAAVDTFRSRLRSGS